MSKIGSIETLNGIADASNLATKINTIIGVTLLGTLLIDNFINTNMFSEEDTLVNSTFIVLVPHACFLLVEKITSKASSIIENFSMSEFLDKVKDEGNRLNRKPEVGIVVRANKIAGTLKTSTR